MTGSAASWPAGQRLATIPRIEIFTATALAGSLPDASVFKSGRQFAAVLRLEPRQNSSSAKSRLGQISKLGNGYLRKRLVIGATSAPRRARVCGAGQAPGVHALWSASLPASSRWRSPTRPREPHGLCSVMKMFAGAQPPANAMADVSDDAETGPLSRHSDVLSGRHSSID